MVLKCFSYQLTKYFDYAISHTLLCTLLIAAVICGIMSDIDAVDNQIKIIDVSYEGVNFNNKKYATYKNMCLRTVSKAAPFKYHTPYWTLYDCEWDRFNSGDVLNKVFVVFGLRDDFNFENIDELTDMLGDTEFSIYIGGVRMADINLFIAYFFADSLGEDILYIDKQELNKKINTGEVDMSHNKYKYLLERLNIDVGENKLIVIPICLDMLIKNLPFKLCRYHEICFHCSFGEEELSLSVKYVNSLYAVCSTIFMNRAKMEIIEDSGNAYLHYTSSVSRKFRTGVGITKPIHLYAYTAQKYAVIKISPDYSETDKSRSEITIEQLPLIHTIVYHSTNTHASCHYLTDKLKKIDSNASKSFAPHDIASFHTGKNCILYVLPCDPSTSVKGWIDRTVKENTDGIEAMMKNKIQCIDINKPGTDIKSASQSKKYYDMTIHMGSSCIPVKIDVYVYKNNMLVLENNMASTASIKN